MSFELLTLMSATWQPSHDEKGDAVKSEEVRGTRASMLKFLSALARKGWKWQRKINLTFWGKWESPAQTHVSSDWLMDTMLVDRNYPTYLLSMPYGECTFLPTDVLCSWGVVGSPLMKWLNRKTGILGPHLGQRFLLLTTIFPSIDHGYISNI